MKKNLAVFAAVALAFAAVAHAQTAAPSKVATIAIQQAILLTGDGKKAQNDLNTKFTPRKSEIEKKQSDIAALQEQLRKGTTLNEDARAKLTRDIDAAQKDLQRRGEDFDSDLQQEEGKIMQDLGQKMMDVVIKHATKNGFAVVIDVSNPQTPVLWADPSADITQEIVKLYDEAHPAPAAGTAAPVKPTVPPVKPLATPPGKKQ